MSFELPDHHREILGRAREVGEKVRSRATEADAATDVDPVMREALRESGLAALTVPAAHGGASEQVDSLAVTVVREAFGGVSAHLDSLFAMQGIGSYAARRRRERAGAAGVAAPRRLARGDRRALPHRARRRLGPARPSPRPSSSATASSC